MGAVAVALSPLVLLLLWALLGCPWPVRCPCCDEWTWARLRWWAVLWPVVTSAAAVVRAGLVMAFWSALVSAGNVTLRVFGTGPEEEAELLALLGQLNAEQRTTVLRVLSALVDGRNDDDRED